MSSNRRVFPEVDPIADSAFAESVRQKAQVDADREAASDALHRRLNPNDPCRDMVIPAP